MRDGLRKDVSLSNAPADRRIRRDWRQVSGPLLPVAQSARASMQCASRAQTPVLRVFRERS